MKKTLSSAWILALLTVVFAFTTQAKEFKGVVTYKITIEGSGVDDQVKTMMPKTMTLTIKGNKARMDMITGMGKSSNISDGDEKITIALIDMMGQKFAIRSTTEEVMKDLEAESFITEILQETKEIAGYNCTKARIRDESTGDEFFVFFTPELGTKALNFDNPQFKDIDGLMLEFEIPNDQFTMRFSAISVEKKNVGDEEFVIPEGYQIKTREEMGSMFGGMGN